MPVTQNAPAPYAPTAAVLSLVERHRNKGLPTPVDAEVLTRSGISDSLNSRTLYALQVLDLIDSQGKPTPIFEGLRLAPEAEYKNRLSDWLASAYADVLAYIDLATADEVQIRDAFRSYGPVGQQNRMVSLFLGLFEAAGIVSERKRQRSKPLAKNGETIRRPKAPSVSSGQSEVRPPPQTTPSTPTANESSHKHPHKYHPFIEGLLATLPNEGENWSSKDRVKWLVLAANAFELIYKNGSEEIVIKTVPKSNSGTV